MRGFPKSVVKSTMPASYWARQWYPSKLSRATNAICSAKNIHHRDIGKAPMALQKEQQKHLRNIGHNLNPVVTVAGKGLTEGVINEINRALDDHELIKLKLAIIDRDIRKQAVTEICSQTKADLVQEIGKVALIFRASDKPNLKTSNVR